MENMKVSIYDVEHVANLSRLTFDDEEKKSIQENLNDIVNYFDIIGKVDCSGQDSKPLSYTIPREDEVKESLDKNDVVGNAPAKNANAFIVPRVVD